MTNILNALQALIEEIQGLRAQRRRLTSVRTIPARSTKVGCCTKKSAEPLSLPQTPVAHYDPVIVAHKKHRVTQSRSSAAKSSQVSTSCCAKAICRLGPKRPLSFDPDAFNKIFGLPAEDSPKTPAG